MNTRKKQTFVMDIDVDNIEKMTSLEIIENINRLMHNSMLKENYHELAEPYINALAALYNLTADEALIVSIIIEITANHYVDKSDIANFLGCSNVKMYMFSKVLDSLVEKGCIRKYKNRRNALIYTPSKDFIAAVVENRMFVKKSLANLNLYDFLAEYTELTDERNNDDLEYDSFISDIRLLISQNMHLPICQFVESAFQNKGNMKDVSTIFVLRACALACLYSRFNLTKFACESLFKNDRDQTNLLRELDSTASVFAKEHIFEPAITPFNPFADKDQVSLTAKFCKKYLQGVKLERRKVKTEAAEGTILCNKIIEKKLYYNAEEAGQISDLAHLLEPDNFKRIQKELKENGHRYGFACLFHGAPGTGKTESAMQLARMTGRNIILVDLSQVRDKFVGESEKNTKAIFDTYREELRRSKVAPILLLNEADGLLEQRLSNLRDSVDQMANTMQNIILQEMENFEGIMIATTNLACNLDKAFDRRFLYKVEFHKPSAEARQAIWSAMIRDLKQSDAKILAEEFEFSGGEIENIARKYVVNNILHNKKSDLESLRQICQSEKSASTTERKVIGF